MLRAELLWKERFTYSRFTYSRFTYSRYHLHENSFQLCCHKCMVDQHGLEFYQIVACPGRLCALQAWPPCSSPTSGKRRCLPGHGRRSWGTRQGLESGRLAGGRIVGCSANVAADSLTHEVTQKAKPDQSMPDISPNQHTALTRRPSPVPAASVCAPAQLR